MKNKRVVKRVISAVLLLAMLVTVTTVFSGCGLFTKKVVGTEAAKILLARERLDAELVGQKTNIVSFNSTQTPSGSPFTDIFGGNSIVASLMGGRMPITAKVAAGAEKLSNASVTWDADSFGDASTAEVAYVQFIEPIDEMAAATAELIATIKEDVGVTDVWVDTMLSKYMLIVDENSETIIEYGKTHKDIGVSIRYTTEDAKCVYEMYSFHNYDDGTSGKIREKCIPGEYYEYVYRNSGGFNDYFIAEKSRGYWLTNRFHFSDQDAFFSLYGIDGNIGYGTDVSVGADFAMPDELSYVSSAVFAPNEDRDIFQISGHSGSYTASIYMTDIESGIDSIVGNSSSYSEEDYGDSGTVYLRGGGRGSEDAAPSIKLSNGGTLNANDTNGKVTYRDVHITYNQFFGEKTYTARIDFSTTAQSAAEAYTDVISYLNENGIKLRSNSSEVLNNYTNCEFLRQNFDIMEWEGYRMNSLSNLKAAEAAIEESFAKYRQLYEDVKDNESVVGARDVARNVDFGEMELVSKGTAAYAGGTISVDGLTARTDDTKLLEKGGLYTLKVGLALRDSEGNISSVHTVSLPSSNEATVTYTGDGLELSQTAQYAVPTALSEGEYVVVVYFATADEGIRVTEMLPVAFFSAEEGKLDSEFMDVTVKRSGDKLFIDYEIKLSETFVATMEKDSYTYDEIKTMLLRKVLAKGYPLSDAVVETSSGEALSESKAYGEGIYRLKYRVNTSDGLVEAYMYCDLEAVHHS